MQRNRRCDSNDNRDDGGSGHGHDHCDHHGNELRLYDYGYHLCGHHNHDDGNSRLTSLMFDKNLTSGVVTDRFYANGLQLANVVNGTTACYWIDDALGSTRLVTTSNAGDVLLFGLRAVRAELCSVGHRGVHVHWEDARHAHWSLLLRSSHP